MLSFGQYAVDIKGRRLLRGADVVPIGGKALDVLRVLAEADGGLVSKDMLIERVWDGRIVADNAIEAQVHAVRKSLGSERALVKTVAGRGYRLDTSVEVARLARTNLEAEFSTLIARDELIDTICRHIQTNRLVSLTGPGGIGKTRLARAAGSRVVGDFRDGVWLVELASVESSQFVSAAIAEALGIKLSGLSTAASVARAIDRRSSLLVLDNCEHVVDEVASVVNVLLAQCPELRILTTTRETLMLNGERVISIPPLGLPLEGDQTDYGSAAPAVRLFTDRLLSGNGSLVSELNLPAVTEICRRLDGIPLAIEMAAASSSLIGVQVVLGQLKSSISILGGAGRSRLPRQQTMEATIEWSYRLLGEPQRRLFRTLSVFTGPFDIKAACDVHNEPVGLTISLLSSLVSKSLLTVSGDAGSFLMLETMRSFAKARLREAGEHPAVSARHAAFVLSVFKTGESELREIPAPDWLARYQPYLPNLRSALEWAFSVDGDAGVGAQIVVTAEPLWLHLSLVGELLQQIERARTSPSTGGFPIDVALILDVSYGCALLYIEGPTSRTQAALERVLSSAYRLVDHGRTSRALWALCAARLNCGLNATALGHAKTFLRRARQHGGNLERLIGHRAIGAVQHVLGNQRIARTELETFLAEYDEPPDSAPTRWFHFDQYVAGSAFYARVRWLHGELEAAGGIGEAALARAMEINHIHSICHSLAQATIPVALARKDYTGAEAYIRTLIDKAAAHGLSIWIAWARAYQSCLRIHAGSLKKGVGHLRALLEDHAHVPFSMYQSGMIGELAVGQLSLGDITSAQQTIRIAIARSNQNHEHWCLPELLRIQAQIAATASSEDRLRARTLIRDATLLSQRQGATWWIERLESTHEALFLDRS